ncbi:Hypothetical protein D9617_13g099720 [Elsinoe fawcettii]|nr:Hypothetical protein D9617_13g099720 [Elsinoe fawcettii]
MGQPTRERLVQTVVDHLKEFNKWTSDSVLKGRTSDAIHEYRPASINAGGELSNEALRAVLDNMRTMVPDFKFVRHEAVMVDVEICKVMLYLWSRAPTKIGVYENTYVWDVTLSPDGTEIERTIETMDGDYANAFMSKLGLVKQRPAPLKNTVLA